jgi:hypothetical protein
MAMPPPGNVTTPSEKLQFPPPANWIPDERDGFISWLRAEFAAANAIIDSLCQHLQAVGDHNEYESVIGSIHHRRLAWSQVLTMQQFFPVADVSYNLQQIAWKRQQQMPPQRHYNSDQVGKFGARRSGPGFNKHHGGGGGYRGADSMARNGHNFNGVNSDRVEHREEAKLASDVKALSVAEEKRDGSEKPRSDSKVEKKLEESETQEEIVKNHKCNSGSKDNSLISEQKQEENDKECPASMAKTFVVQEMYDAKMVSWFSFIYLFRVYAYDT